MAEHPHGTDDRGTDPPATAETEAATDERPEPGRLERARSSVTDRFSEVRGRSAIVDGLASTWVHDSEVGGGVMAGALAFRLFLFLVPFVLFVFTALGASSEAVNKSPEDLATSAGISGLLAQGVVNTATFSTGQKWTILLVSGYATFMAARSFVKTLSDTVCLAWRIPRVRLKKTRPAIAFIIYFTIASFLTAELGRLRSAAPTPGVLLTLAWLAVPFVSIWWLMAKLPRRPTPTWTLLPGAAVAAVGFQLMHLVTVWFIAPSTTSKTETYGVIGISLATLLWCYIAGRIVIGCTVLNAALWRRYEMHHPDLAQQRLDPDATLVSRAVAALRSSFELFR